MSNCSVHPELCMWELALEGAKSNADTAIRRMWAAESQAHKMQQVVKAAKWFIECGNGMNEIQEATLALEKAVRELENA